jgi:hypothetical protein
MTGGTKNWRGLIRIVALLLISGQSTFARPEPSAWQPRPMKRPPAGTNSAQWHTITITPHPGRPKIHFYQKLNPVWWFENLDEPVPPAWYKPEDKQRVTKWHFRNPLHNFNNYVIGVADKAFVRSGKYPERNSRPHGGWDFEVARRKLVLLPYFSYSRGSFNFYFGWREHGSFGIKLNFSTPPGKATNEVSRPRPEVEASQPPPEPAPDAPPE